MTPQWASLRQCQVHSCHGPLARYVKLQGCACAGNADNVFSSHRLQRNPIVSDPGMHHGTCVTHVPWCTSGSLTRDGGENVPGIPGACATRHFAYLARGPWDICDVSVDLWVGHTTMSICWGFTSVCRHADTTWNTIIRLINFFMEWFMSRIQIDDPWKKEAHLRESNM